MRKLLLVAALAFAGATLALADEFAGLSFDAELAAEAMAAIDGQLLTITVPFNSKGTATVTHTERYGSSSFTVPVTTVAKSACAANPPKDSAGKIYTPVPLPKGTYDLGSSKTMSNSNFGTGIKIKVTVNTPYKDGSGSFKANDFFVHPTPYNNTWGCVGVQASEGSSASANMDKIVQAFKSETGSKIVSVK